MGSTARMLVDLRLLSDGELMFLHDSCAGETQVGVSYYLAELARRDQERATKAMLLYTRWMIVMTVIITVATLVSTWCVFRQG